MKKYKYTEKKVLINGKYFFQNEKGIFEIEEDDIAIIFERLGAKPIKEKQIKKYLNV